MASRKAAESDLGTVRLADGQRADTGVAAGRRLGTELVSTGLDST